MLLNNRTIVDQSYPFIRKHWLFLTGALLFILAGGVSLLLYEQGAVLVYINTFRSDGADVFFKVATRLAEPVAYVTILITVAAFNYRRAIFAVFTGAAAGVVAGLLKWIFAQPRPLRWFFDHEEAVWHQLNHFEEHYRNWSETTSFPSGHTTSAFALYGFLAFNAKRGRRRIQFICLCLAVLVALSRMYLLYHFLRDVTAGAALGLVVGVVVYRWQPLFFPSATWLERGWLGRKAALPPPRPLEGEGGSPLSSQQDG